MREQHTEQTATCEECGTVFDVTRPHNPNRFCSWSCRGRHGGRVAKTGQQGQVTTCRQCGITFTITSPTNPNRYCSPACLNAARRERYAQSANPAPLTGDTAICQNPACGVEFAVKRGSKGLYCSRACVGRHMISSKETHPRWKGGALTLTCANCGEVFTRPRLGKQTARERQYCTPECKKAHMRGPNAATWKGGRFPDAEGYIRVYVGKDHPAAFTGTAHAHEHVVVAMKTLGRPLRPDEHVHHVDGNTANNDPSNLHVMTASEHMRLHRSKSK